MFGLWYITFGCLALVAVSLIFGIIAYKAEKHHEKRAYAAYSQRQRLGWIDDPDRSKRTELDDLQREEEHKESMCETCAIVGFGVSIVAGVASFILLLVSIFVPITARAEVNYFIAQKEYVELAVENGSDLENIAITQTIIEQNTWLSQAKASKCTYGVFSRYYGVDLDVCEPIVIKRGKE